MAKKYVVQKGDSLASIAEKHGFIAQTLWDDPNNKVIKQKRTDPDMLVPGDVLLIPDKKIKEASANAGGRVKFKIKRSPIKLRLKIFEEPTDPVLQQSGAASDSEAEETHIEDPVDNAAPEQAAKNKPYSIEVMGKWISGSTNGERVIEADLPGHAKSARLFIEPGTKRERQLTIHLGALAPIDSVIGVKQRLSNLGYP